VEGKGTQDIVFFMIESFNITRINRIKNLLINYYYEKLLELGIDYKRKDFEKDIVISSCFFPMLVAIWFGTTNKNELNDKNFPFRFVSKFVNFLAQLDFVLIENL
jgi:hypothetical protein